MYKIGIDEAGRGPWLGSVVACALCFNPEAMPPKEFLSKMTDSKQLTEKKREELFKELVEMSKSSPPVRGKLEGGLPQVFFGVGVVDNHVIDEINIKQANKEAMRRAIVELLRKVDKEKIASVLVDGKDNYKFDELDRQPVYIIGGDAKVTEISAASIIAKVFRDKLMSTYGELYPDLGIESHKGYGTKKHREYLNDKSKITSIHRVSYKPVKAILEAKPKLLLHICCGPDATVPIMDLKDKYDITCFWYDPNIQPKSEYDKRLEHFKKVCEIEKVPYIEGPYDVENFFLKIKGLENTPEKGEKCTQCYDIRLQKTSELAVELGIKYWTTTLNISPHKDVEKLFKLGDKHSLKNNLEFLKIAFRKNKGFERSVEYTKKHKIYRQNYCGCIYSDTFPKDYKLDK
ncbi:MAG: epoxyqueuosine reductase QueH [Candidatus Gracilibacteria bacterium]|nr:epoxyqueuosine reductase QueH [Candidatus Gracilibacteria bacterium]